MSLIQGSFEVFVGTCNVWWLCNSWSGFLITFCVSAQIDPWLQEHQEMINSSKSWMAEAQSWLAAPCTYTTAKCLSSHVHALRIVLDDSAQIRTTLQGFSSVLKEMSQVCDVTTLQEQLVEADGQVAVVQDSFTAPLSQLEHAAAVSLNSVNSSVFLFLYFFLLTYLLLISLFMFMSVLFLVVCLVL